jgi:signal transduction histidine kinase
LLGNALPYFTFFIALAFTRWFTNLLPSLLNFLLGALAARWFFSAPRYSLALDGGVESWAFALAVCFVALSLVIFGEGMRRATRRAEQKATALEAEIACRQQTATELTLARDRLAADLADMNRLDELNHRLLRETELVPMLHQVLQASMELLGAGKGHVQLYDERNNTLEIVTQVGFKQEFVERFKSTPADFTCCGVAVKKRQRMIVEDVHQDPTFVHLAPIYAASGFVACQSTPLHGSNGQVFGVLSTHFGQPHRPSERELRLLDLYAQTAERVIERKLAQAALERAEAELRRKNVELEERVNERTARLRESVAELEGFSYSITHDLRAPLRAMQGFAQYLAHECGSEISGHGKDYIRRIITSANRMDQLIQDVLAYSYVLRTELKLEPIDVTRLVRGILDSYPDLDRARADIQIQGTLPKVLANEAALTQCISNLLDNAVKFVAPGVKPQVTIRAEPKDSHVRLWFEDNGIGIEPEHHERIFTMFQRLDKRFDGTGIGLAIVRKAAERMGGEVGLVSVPGKGSGFWIQLRREPDNVLPIDTVRAFQEPTLNSSNAGSDAELQPLRYFGRTLSGLDPAASLPAKEADGSTATS